jgi:hypothetical protein
MSRPETSIDSFGIPGMGRFQADARMPVEIPEILSADLSAGVPSIRLP